MQRPQEADRARIGPDVGDAAHYIGESQAMGAQDSEPLLHEGTIIRHIPCRPGKRAGKRGDREATCQMRPHLRNQHAF